MTLRYIIADDSFYSRVFLTEIIKSGRPDLQLVGSAEETWQVLNMLRDSFVDLIVARDKMSDGSLMRVLLANHVSVPVILIHDGTSDIGASVGLNLVDIVEPVAPYELFHKLDIVTEWAEKHT